MKKILILLAAATVCTTAAAQTVYKCPGGRYTAEFYNGCTELEGGDVGSYTASQPSGTYSTTFESGSGSTAQNTAADARAKRIAEAERALEEGRSTRMGNERNYAKYQERIRELELNLERAKQGK